MFSELSHLLSWPTGIPPAGESVLIADSHKDASFLLHHFITASLKAGHHVCLVSFAQILAHYINAAKKMGTNITQYQEQGTFAFIDCMTKLLDTDTASSATTTEPASVASSAIATTVTATTTSRTFSLGWSGNPLRPLYDMIQTIVGANDRARHVVIIDDLNIPITIGIAEKHVAAFFDACQALVSSQSPTTKTPRGNLIVLAHDPYELKSQSKTHFQSWLVQYCAFRASTTLCAKDLSTGLSKEIHGQLTLCTRDGSPSVVERNFHFKVNDQSVSFFARGTSSAVL